ncbi:hypothetical protein BV25DRAFT_977281 [Artomyces pyxidatus]|uniref:Uncharacterized protein n=1 Tax=Artomyces pyxidatus TaxID=48021 RepID=A0ACB8SVW5_9AGAM|nr:hypothetical protein BV25DRAFT_977281 [Artomyces pyxidatus]
MIDTLLKSTGRRRRRPSFVVAGRKEFLSGGAHEDVACISLNCVNCSSLPALHECLTKMAGRAFHDVRFEEAFILASHILAHPTDRNNAKKIHARDDGRWRRRRILKAEAFLNGARRRRGARPPPHLRRLTSPSICLCYGKRDTPACSSQRARYASATCCSAIMTRRCMSSARRI